MALLSGAIVKVHTAKGHLVCWFTPPPHGPYRKALSPLSDNGEVQSRPLARRRAAPFRRRPGNKTGFPGKAGRVAGRFRTGKRPRAPAHCPRYCSTPATASPSSGFRLNEYGSMFGTENAFSSDDSNDGNTLVVDADDLSWLDTHGSNLPTPAADENLALPGSPIPGAIP